MGPMNFRIINWLQYSSLVKKKINYIGSGLIRGLKKDTKQSKSLSAFFLQTQGIKALKPMNSTT